MPEVFISYSRKDAEFALKLTADLERRGIQVWIDQGDIVAGDAWRKQIVEGIQSCRVFLVILSPRSATSENVVKELSIAESGHKKIVPILYQPVEIPKEMEYQLAGLQYQAFDHGDYEENVARLVQVISGQTTEKTAQRGPAPSAAKGPHLGKIALGVGGVLIVLLVVCLGSILLSGPISIALNAPSGTPTVTSTTPNATTLAPTTPPRTTIAPVSPIIMCTPPLCKSDETYYCPGGNCPGGCGTQCATQTPPRQTPPSPTNVPSSTRRPTQTPSPLVIPFGSATNPYQLNPVFRWRQGGSTYSNASLSRVSSAVIITGGPNADSWADKDQMPLLLYSISGDFDAQVKMDFSPKMCNTYAAMGVRSATDNLTWIRFLRGCINSPAVGSIAIDLDNHGAPGRAIGPINFNFPNPAYLRIQRRGGSSFTCSYGPNGNDWTRLSDFSFQMPTSVEIFLTATSYGDTSAQAYFDDFRVAAR